MQKIQLNPPQKKHFKAYIDNKNCKLVAACDPDTRRLEELSDKWGSFKTYSSLDRLLKENSIDVLSICSPTEKHFENFDLACKAGVKKIWLEKPSAENSNLLKINTQITYNDVFLHDTNRRPMEYCSKEEAIKKAKEINGDAIELGTKDGAASIYASPSPQSSSFSSFKYSTQL